MEEVLAHIRSSDGAAQILKDHLNQVAALASSFCTAISLPLCGQLLGLVHDLGKASREFQVYLKGACGLLGEAARVRAMAQQGKIDHATARAQWINECLGGNPQRLVRMLTQILAVVVMSHHSRAGMADMLSLEGDSPYLERLGKPLERTRLREALAQAEPQVLAEINALLASPALVDEVEGFCRIMARRTRHAIPLFCGYAFLTRFLFSALLDADRLDTADFENEAAARFRSRGKRPEWGRLRDRLETHLAGFPGTAPIHAVRASVSDACRRAAANPERLVTLTVPTGGGKTLASLRYALHRAADQTPDRIDRIIYILPYTSIIDQNAAGISRILGGDVVLEHHSNLAPERDTWRARVLSENWDSPVVFTTLVQFLDALFNQSTRSARRMHQLANAILIFDEIQTLPVRMVHLFNNALDFLTAYCHTTAMLCTATMPLLNQVRAEYGCLALGPQQEVIPDKTMLFEQLRRTQIIDRCRTGGWSYAALCAFAMDEVARHKSLLIVCNTKTAARAIYEELCAAQGDALVIHLSTNLCPAHRKDRIDEIASHLDKQPECPLICVSTQLIEAGVDLDFGCVIRSLAGLDSIIQAGGRCNRHQKRPEGSVYIVNLAEEKLPEALVEIRQAQEITLRVLGEFRDDPAALGGNLLSEAAMNRFYFYQFHQRRTEMLYPVRAGKHGELVIRQDTTLLELLSTNAQGIAEACRGGGALPSQLFLPQAFSTAAQLFEVIDAPTTGVIVPYQNDQEGRDGRALIANLVAAMTNEGVPPARQVQRLREAQQYTVNVFPHLITRLRDEGALHEVAPETGIFYLDERYYHPALGVTLEAFSEQHYLEVS